MPRWSLARSARLLRVLTVTVPSAFFATEVVAAPDPSVRAGVWTIAMDGSNRQCRIQLRTDASGADLALSMPPGCHRALPILNAARGWSMPDEAHVAFLDESGQAILLFEDSESGGLHAAGAEGNGGYTLTGVGAGHATPPRATVVAPAEATAAPIAKPVAILSAAAVAGNYAVLRGDRDTGCMVTLDEKERGPKTSLKAHLAPACRDQGIVIFDPIGWQLQAGRLVLTARKGHTTDLDRGEAGQWTKNATFGKPLTLKRL